MKQNPRIRFVGYVPEGVAPDLFRTASLTVLPYTSSAGSAELLIWHVNMACLSSLPISKTSSSSPTGIRFDGILYGQ